MSKYILSFFLCTVLVHADTNANPTKIQRAQAVITLAKQAHVSCELFEQYFNARYNCNITDASSYTDIKAELSKPQRNRTKLVKKALAAFTTGPFAPALVKEVELEKVGYHVFYSSQSKSFAFMQDFTTAFINELASRGIGESLRDDFLYINNMVGLLGPRPNWPKDCLPANTALLGNLNAPETSEWLYAFNDKETFKRTLDIYKDIFQSCGITHLAAQYQKRIEQLHKQFIKRKHGGRLLQIAVPEGDRAGHVSTGEKLKPCWTENDRKGFIEIESSYLLSPQSSVKIFVYDTYEYDAEYLRWCIKRDELIVEMVNSIIENRTIIDTLVAGTTEGTKYERATALRDLIKEAHTSYDALVQFFKLRYGCDIDGLYSFMHIQAVIFGQKYHTYKQYKNDASTWKRIEDAFASILTGPFERALAKEAELDAMGYASFYHGQRQQWAFQEDFTTALIKELSCRGLCKPLRDDFLYIQNIPNFLTSKPGKSSQYSLSVNICLLGNAGSPGCCSWLFALNDNNEDDIPLNIKRDIFEAFGITQLTDKYYDKVMALRSELATLKKGGRLLQVAVPKTDTPEQLGCEIDGYREYCGADGTETSLWLHDDNYVLNHQSPVKIFAYDAYDHDSEYLEWCAKRDKLIVEMVDDLVEGGVSFSVE